MKECSHLAHSVPFNSASPEYYSKMKARMRIALDVTSVSNCRGLSGFLLLYKQERRAGPSFKHDQVIILASYYLLVINCYKEKMANRRSRPVPFKSCVFTKP